MHNRMTFIATTILEIGRIYYEKVLLQTQSGKDCV